MTIYRGPGGTGSATSDADTNLYQQFLEQSLAARDAALAAQTAAELAETNAETAETNAETAATAAASSASSASSSASAAANSASNASSSASAAASSASSASTSATNAANSATAAADSATSAANSASTATTQASNASSSATDAASSASSAATSATNAASSASSASTSATNAANSATNASNSASSAATSATNAANSATSASNSATAAAASASEAAGYAASINPADLVHISGTETITGAKTFSTNPTLSGGTANGVAYLNGSKVLTSDSALTFDGTSLGVGTTTPGTYGKFVVNGNAALLAAGAPYFYNAANDAWSYIKNSASAGSADLTFNLFGSEQMRLTSTGLGIGTSSPGQKLVVSGSGAQRFDIVDTGGATGRISTVNNVVLVGTTTNHPLGLSTNDAERARIDSSGNLLVGTTSNGSGAQFFVVANKNTYAMSAWNYNAAPLGLNIYYASAAPNNTGSEFFVANDSVGIKASVRSNGGIANFSGNNVNLSDRREKTNFAPAKSYLETICAIPVQTFNYIDQNMEEDPGTTLGVVAQDVQAVAPELVMESNWGTKEDPKMRLSIYQTDLQYALMKALQELKAEFDAYKAAHP